MLLTDEELKLKRAENNNNSLKIEFLDLEKYSFLDLIFDKNE